MPRNAQPAPDPTQPLMRYRAPWRLHEPAEGYEGIRADEPNRIGEADIRPGSWDPETRTIELVWTTGARVLRRDWWTGELWHEELSTDPKHVRLERLNSGAPFLDSHMSWGNRSVLGVHVDGSVRMENGQGVAKVRFSKAPSKAEVVEDIADGIIRKVSTGYRIHEWAEVGAVIDGQFVEGHRADRKKGEIPVMRAVDWEPYENSAVPLPADNGAGFRGLGRTDQEAPVTTKTAPRRNKRADEETCPECEGKDDCTCEDAGDGGGEGDEAARAAAKADAERAREARVRAEERARIRGIETAARALKLEGNAEVRKLVDDGVKLDAARTRLFELAAERDDAAGINGRHGGGVEAGATEVEKLRSCVENAILHRFNPKAYPLDAGRSFTSMSILEVGRRYIERCGHQVRSYDKHSLAAEILGFRSGGLHHSSDFTILLENVTGKELRRAFEEVKSPWETFCREVTLPDYKDVSRVQLSEAPSLEPIPELGEYTYGTFSDGKVTWRIHKAGRLLGVSREAMINDDLGGILRQFQMFGGASQRYRADKIYALITGNPVFDGKTLFHADRNNLLGDLAPSLESIDAMDSAIGLQRGSGEIAELGLTLRTILSPRATRMTFRQLTSGKVNANTAEEVIPEDMEDVQVVSDARLTRANAYNYYGVADPSQIDTIEHGYLEGAAGPQMERKDGFEIDGVTWKVRLEWGCALIDWRGFVKVAYDGPA